MSLRMTSFGLGLVAWLAAGCSSSADSATQHHAEGLAVELGEVDASLHAASAEVGAGRYEEGRLTVAEAIRRLFAWPKPQRGTDWVCLLNAAADTARDAHHLAAERSAREHAYAWFQEHLPDNHPDLLAARQALARTLEALGDTEGANALRQAVRGSSRRDATPSGPVPALQSPR